MLSQTTEYALRAMACLAQTPNELVPTGTLAERSKVPANYMSKVLQQLAAADLITGRRGVGGGYRLSRSPGQISLLDVVNAVGEVRRIQSCPLGREGHDAGLCALHRKEDEAAAAVIKVFEGSTLADVACSGGRPLCDQDHSATLTVSVPKR